MSTREEIIARLRAQKRVEPLPSRWRSRRHFDDLAEQFTLALTSVKGEVRRAPNWPGALDEVARLLSEINATSAVIDDHPSFAALEPTMQWSEINWFVVGRTAGDLRDFATRADVGISGADAALAETGSVVVSTGPGRSRLTSLLPPVHLALVPVSCLTIDIFTWLVSRPQTLPSSLTVISGPSKTADIEQTLTVGVHGPRRFIAILYGE